jgi:hypothetical protein
MNMVELLVYVPLKPILYVFFVFYYKLDKIANGPLAELVRS